MYKSGELHANVSLAMLLLEMGQHQKVSPILNQASELAQSLNSTETMLLCWGLSAVLNLDTGNLFLAEEQLNKAIANTEHDPEFYSNSLFAIKGYLMGLTHRWEDALDCHNQAMTDFAELPPARKIEVLFYSARMLLRQNKAQQAAEFLQRADNMAIENEMLGYGLRVRALQQHPSLCTPKAQQSFQLLLAELTSQLSPSDQDTLIASLQRIIT